MTRGSYKGTAMELCTIAMAMAMGFDDSTRGSTWTWTLSALGGDWLLLLVPVALRLQTSFAAAVTPTKRCITASAHGSPQASAVCAAVTCALHSLVLARCPVAQPPPHCRAAAREPCPVCRCRALRGPWTRARIVASYVPTLHSFSPRHCASSSSHEGRPRWCRLSTAAMCNVCSPP
jgi:hypothetical protein